MGARGRLPAVLSILGLAMLTPAGAATRAQAEPLADAAPTELVAALGASDPIRQAWAAHRLAAAPEATPGAIEALTEALRLRSESGSTEERVRRDHHLVDALLCHGAQLAPDELAALHDRIGTTQLLLLIALQEGTADHSELVWPHLPSESGLLSPNMALACNLALRWPSRELVARLGAGLTVRMDIHIIDPDPGLLGGRLPGGRRRAIQALDLAAPGAFPPMAIYHLSFREGYEGMRLAAAGPRPIFWRRVLPTDEDPLPIGGSQDRYRMRCLQVLAGGADYETRLHVDRAVPWQGAAACRDTVAGALDVERGAWGLLAVDLASRDLLPAEVDWPILQLDVTDLRSQATEALLDLHLLLLTER